MILGLSQQADGKRTTKKVASGLYVVVNAYAGSYDYYRSLRVYDHPDKVEVSVHCFAKPGRVVEQESEQE